MGAAIAGRSGKRAKLALVFFIMLMDVVGISVFFPVAPFIVGKYSHEASMVTMLTVIYSAAQFVAAPILGRLSDRVGRRPVLIWSLAGSAVGYLMFGLSGSLWMLFLSRLVSGFAGGNMSTASVYIADISEPGELAKNFTAIGMAWGIGLVVGPMLGSAAGQLDLNAPAFIAMSLMALGLVLTIFVLPESLPAERRDAAPLTLPSVNPFNSIWGALRLPATGWLLLVSCVFNLAVNGTNGIGSIYMVNRYYAQQWQTGLLLMLVGAALALIQLLLIPVVVPKAGERRVAVAAFAGLALCGAVLFLRLPVAGYFVFYILMSGLSGFVYPTLTTLITGSVGHRDLGGIMGVMTALGSLMTIAGQLWGGFAFDRLSPEAPFVICAALCACAFAMLAFQRKRGVQKELSAVPGHVD